MSTTRLLPSSESSSDQTSEIEKLRRRNRELVLENEDLQGQLDDAKQTMAGLTAPIAALKSILRPLYNSLRGLFEGMDFVEDLPLTQPQSSVASGSNPKWEALKRAFPGRCAELIDTLAAHGELTTTAISTIMRADHRTVSQLIFKLNKAGAIEKNGGKFRLKP